MGGGGGGEDYQQEQYMHKQEQQMDQAEEERKAADKDVMERQLRARRRAGTAGSITGTSTGGSNNTLG